MPESNHDRIEKAAKELGVELDYDTVIEAGDLYLACRNGPAQLLTCKINLIEKGYIVPVENAYPFNWCDCVKIK